jgi:phosphate transport system substrate-binding protein
MKKVISLAFAGLIALAGIAYAASTVITVKGSDTMVILAQRWAEKYMKSNANVTIQVTGGGSGTGISGLINGTTDICNASRPMKVSEREKLKQRYNTLGVEVKAAQDGLAVYVHEANPVKTLSLEQLNLIYTGSVTNWKDVGGPDEKIVLYGRENSSGTHVYFRDFVLKGKDYSATMQTMPGTAAVVNAVAKDKFSVGYGGAAYATGVRFMNVSVKTGEEGYVPSAETVKAGKYPITRYLYIYLKSKPAGDIKKYIDWILSPEGQAIVSEVGYFPVK